MAYPSGFFGCPETPPPPAKNVFLNHGVDTILSQTFTSHLNLRNLEREKPDTNSGYATVERMTLLKVIYYSDMQVTETYERPMIAIGRHKCVAVALTIVPELTSN